MRNMLPGLLSLIFMVSASAFANCPDPSEIYYEAGFKKNYPVWQSNNGAWTTDTENVIYDADPSAADTKIVFVAVKISTGNGNSEGMLRSASPHARCIYNLTIKSDPPSYQLIILRPTNVEYHWTIINTQYKRWEYIPYGGDPNYGDWQCSSSLGSCSFSGW